MDNNFNFEPIVQEEVLVTKKKHVGLFVGLGCGLAALAVAIVLTLCAINGVFISKPKKVVYAGAKTFEDALYVDELKKFMEFAGKSEYTMSIEASYEDYEGSLDYIVTKDKKAFTGAFKGNIYSTDVEVSASAVLDSKYLSVTSPFLGDYVAQYNYTELPTGDLFKTADEDSLAVVNYLLSYLYKYEVKTDYSKKTQDAILKELKKMKFEDVDAEDFTIGDKEKSCKGYQVTVTGKNLSNILDNVYKACGSDMKDELKEFAQIAGEEFDLDGIDELDDQIEDMKEELEDMEDIVVTFYLNGNTYAAIYIDVKEDGEKHSIKILFEGGDRPTQNMKIKVDGNTVTELKGSTEDGVDKADLYAADVKVLSLRYDRETGVTKVTAYTNGEAYNFKIKINTDRESASIKLYDLDDMEDAELSIKFTSDAKIPSLKGEKIDVSTASEDELNDLIQAVQKAVMEIYYGNDMD